MTTSSANAQRLAHLDGLRGVAVLLVLFFHFFERWPSFYPYGSALLMPLPALTAWTGVWLFFVISGFVITLTLHRCASFMEFLVRRFARLWPPMLLCACLSYIVLSVIPANPFPVSPRNFLPSLTFIDPYVFDVLLHRGDFDWMDGAYWSLFVEVQFYALISLVYFLGPRRFVSSFLLLSSVVMACGPLATLLGMRKLDAIVETSMLPRYLPFFVMGVGFYRAHIGQRMRPFIALGLLGLLSQVTVTDRAEATGIILSTAFVVTIAWLGIRTGRGRSALSTRWISTIGVASYSLYLLHQRIGVAVIHAAAARLHLHGPAALVLPLLTAVTLIFATITIYRYWEAPLNRLIVARLIHTAGTLQERLPTAGTPRAST